MEGSINIDSVNDGQLKDALIHFVNNCNAGRLSKGLRNILLDYIRLQFEVLPVGFEELLGDFFTFFELMDAIEKVHNGG
ncbi:hypothetical protein [Taibaiella soli]|uniref:Uncharacterized protein n=1 Tax=Taibaiella soli TaxID=1649169 RepID=A0A2W2ABA2_9BACT|nr:hypothetical protein [Taibaiella soli]PZF72581.1 hypothetical protein DN068_12000 [Taibaiella soli]